MEEPEHPPPPSTPERTARTARLAALPSVLAPALQQQQGRATAQPLQALHYAQFLSPRPSRTSSG